MVFCQGAGMFPQEIVTKKRDAASLKKAEIEYFVKGVVDGTFQDYQSAALLMAILLNGMSTDETSWLTQAMMHSGEVMDLSSIPKIKVDKHSTGGVGDKVSIILAPLAASCGVCVPMISGRGLGHTGGTLDKLQSIPGFRIDLSNNEFYDLLSKIGVAMIGQTATIAPADKKLYALRDVTATVESIPLICASIMSKKLAEGIDALVLDVKFGKGAFMKTLPKAKELAESMVAIGHNMNRQTVAFLTDMNQPLGQMIGNSLEIIESIECLKNRGPRDLMDLTIALTAEMVVLAKIAPNLLSATRLILDKLSDGSALEKFREMIQHQSGNPNVIDDYNILPTAKYRQDLLANKSGYIHEIDALKIGIACMILGAGRKSIQDQIDPSVGCTHLAKVGAYVKANERLCCIHYNEQSKFDEALKLFQEAIVIQDVPPQISPLIAEVIRDVPQKLAPRK